jgi:peptidoglycan L-alanyl-D-glutamate endopeptidase CwlK
MDAITSTRLQELYPELARRWTQADQMLESLGFTIRVDQGLRTWPQQEALWDLGRDEQGNIVELSKVVTHARPGESYHNYGLALDFVPMENGDPIWDRTHPAYAKTIEVAESMGLVSGSHWPEPKTDFPHLQLTGNFPEDAPDDNCKYLFREGGLSAVWRDVDAALWITSD